MEVKSLLLSLQISNCRPPHNDSLITLGVVLVAILPNAYSLRYAIYLSICSLCENIDFEYSLYMQTKFDYTCDKRCFNSTI